MSTIEVRGRPRPATHAARPCRSLEDQTATPVDRVLITGGAGFLGREVSRLLGDRSRVFDRRPNIVRPDSVVGDLLDGSRLAYALDGCRTVVHLAALHGPDCDRGASVADLWRCNVEGTRRLVEAAERAGVQRLVFVSTTSVYDSDDHPIIGDRTPAEPKTDYGRSKLEGECLVAESSMSTNILRPARFTFPDRTSRLVRFISGAVDIEDLAQAIVRIVREEMDTPTPFIVAAPPPIASSNPSLCSGVLHLHLSAEVAIALDRLGIPRTRPTKMILGSQHPDVLGRKAKDFFALIDEYQAEQHATSHRPRWLRPAVALAIP